MKPLLSLFRNPLIPMIDYLLFTFNNLFIYLWYFHFYLADYSAKLLNRFTKCFYILIHILITDKIRNCLG